MRSYYKQQSELTEAECYTLLMDGDEQWKMAVDNDIDNLIHGVQELGGTNFGRLQAAMLLYRMIEYGYYP